MQKARGLWARYTVVRRTSWQCDIQLDERNVDAGACSGQSTQKHREQAFHVDDVAAETEKKKRVPTPTSLSTPIVP